MAELSRATMGDLVAGATQKDPAETLRQAFFDQRGHHPSPSELRSWQPADDLSEPT
jgi:hypothetical protein